MRKRPSVIIVLYEKTLFELRLRNCTIKIGKLSVLIRVCHDKKPETKVTNLKPRLSRR